MSKPKTLKSALEAGYVIYKLYAKYENKIRVTVKEQFHQADRKMFIDFWIDRDYFKRNYPNAYDRL
mgnify:FL=1|nr:MAG TPA: hypothetical protein [Caudoviricetes sp.]